MENIAENLVYGTHVIACKTRNGIVVPEFYRQGLLYKERIIDTYYNFAPIYDLTLKRTYQVTFPRVVRELFGLPEELETDGEVRIDELVFDKTLGVREVFTALAAERRAWFINEFYQLLCLEHGLYPAKNYGQSNDECHPYILFILTDFTKELGFPYGSIDEYMREYYDKKKGAEFGTKSKFDYILFKAEKLPKTVPKLFRSMYCGEKRGQRVLSAYYDKKASVRKKLLRKLDAMMKRRAAKYGLFAD